MNIYVFLFLKKLLQPKLQLILSDKALKTIIEHASDNLEKLGIDTYVNLKVSHLYELKSMTKLKVLYFHIGKPNFYLKISSLDGNPLNSA